METFDLDLATFDRLLPVIQTVAKDRIAGLRHERNRLSPFYKFLVEILPTIFEEYLELMSKEGQDMDTDDKDF